MQAYQYEFPPGLNERPYQIEAADAIFGQFAKGVNSTLLTLPTGTGKTAVAAMVIQRGSDEHKWKTLFLAQRRKLVRQAVDTFGRWGIESCIEMGDLKVNEQESIFGKTEAVVGTVQSLSGKRLTSKPKDSYDLIIIDECHHAQAQAYKNVVDHFQGAKLMGVTATPDGSKKNLGSIFETNAYNFKLRSAIEQGYLVNIKLRTIPTEIDLRELKITGADFSELETGMRITAACETIAFNVKEHVGDRPTVVFTPDLGSASAMASMLRGMGMSAKYVASSSGTYGMPEDERDMILDEFNRDEFQVIVSCDMLIEGWDQPKISCVVIARPTLQRHRAVQMIGRGTRLFPGKTDLLVLDFDWRTDPEVARKLCVPVSLFADDADDDVMDAVTKKFKASKGKPGQVQDEFDFNLLDEVKEEEAKRRFSKELAIRYTGKYATKYESYDSDPVGLNKVLDLGLKAKHDHFNKTDDPDKGGGPITQDQAHYLRFLGMQKPDGLSRWGASKMIQKLESRDKRGEGSFQQVKRLLAAGVDPEQARSMSRRDAAKVIADLIAKSEQQSFF